MSVGVLVILLRVFVFVVFFGCALRYQDTMGVKSFWSDGTYKHSMMSHRWKCGGSYYMKAAYIGRGSRGICEH